MTYEISGDPTEVAHFAGQVLKAGNALGDALDPAQKKITLSASDFGNSEGASGVSDASQSLLDAGSAAASRLQTVIVSDVDGLYRTAFAMQDTDEANANKLDVVN